MCIRDSRQRDLAGRGRQRPGLGLTGPGPTARIDEPAAPAGAGGLVRVRLDVAYAGAAYAGWARQPDLPSVQRALEQALSTVLHTEVTVRVAGRTDAGVHAVGQVATTDVAAETWAEAEATLLRRLTGVLPDDVRVSAVGVMPAGFDVRFSALSRTYRYRVADAAWGVDPLRRADTWAYGHPVDLDRMQAASVGLSLIHISEPTRLLSISYAVFCLK